MCSQKWDIQHATKHTSIQHATYPSDTIAKIKTSNLFFFKQYGKESKTTLSCCCALP